MGEKIKNRNIYSLKKLEKFYQELLSGGVRFYLLKDLAKIDKGIILRHDLESEMDSVLPMATLEQRLGIKSSYFFLLTSRFYNPYSMHCRDILYRIIEMGHEVGLHFDSSIYPEDKLEEAFTEERHILEVIIGQKVYSMSLHNPSETGKYPYFENVVNAYNWNIFSPKNYFSDSGFGFRATAKQVLEEARQNVVQLLLHPMLYCILADNERPNRINITKIEIERFANTLVGSILVHPLFAEEIKNYPHSHLNIRIKIKD